MDYAYSPIENINFVQRLTKPLNKIITIYGKRTIKIDNNNFKIIRIKK